MFVAPMLRIAPQTTLSCSRNCTMRCERLAVVLDLLAGFALGRGADRHDLLAGTGPADLVGAEAEVGDGHLVDRLVLRRHDPLERRVAGLDHTGGHAHDRGQRRLDHVVARLGLALDGDLAVADLHVLGERERRPAEQLGDLRRHRAGVAVGRLGGGDHEVDVAGALDRLREHLGRGQRVGAGERVVGDEHGPGRAHRERGAQARDLAVGRHRDEDDLAAARLLGELQRHLDAVGVGVVEDELARAVEGVVGVELARAPPGRGSASHRLRCSFGCSVVVVSGRADEPVTPPDDLILAAIGTPVRNVGTSSPRARTSDVLVVGAGPAGVAAGHRGPPPRARRARGRQGHASPATRPAATASPPARCACSTQLGLDVRTLPSYAAVTRPCWCRRPAARSCSRSPPTARTRAWCRGRARRRARATTRARAASTCARAPGVAVARRRRTASRSTLADGTDRRPRVGRRGRRPLLPRAPAAHGDRARAPTSARWHAFRQYFSGVDDRRLWVLFEEDLLPGYAWVFPVGDGRANVGFGVLRDGNDGATERQGARRAVARRSSTARACAGSSARTPSPKAPCAAWPIPARSTARASRTGRVLFAGDAAGVVDPMTGEGIAQALETGMLAARADRASPDDAAAVAAATAPTSTARWAPTCASRRAPARAALPLGARAASRAAALTPWTRRNFARWMFEDYPRALLLTPRRWRRGHVHRPGPIGGRLTSLHSPRWQSLTTG